MNQEAWQNDLYGHLAAAPAEQVNPIAGGLLQTLDDPRFQTLRSSMLDDMHLYPGSTVLELGCGPGMLLEDLCERVGEEGQVHGLDLNPHFINLADRRAAMFGLDNATFVAGDCRKLPYEDNMFDAISAEKLLMHVAPAAVAISEMVRVLSPGGRLVLAEYDPYAVLVSGPTPAITARVMDSASHIYATPTAAREAPLACVKAGLYVEQVRGYLQVFEDPDLPTVSGIPDVWSEHAMLGRQIDRGTARRWLKSIEFAAREGRFLIAIPFIVTVAMKH